MLQISRSDQILALSYITGSNWLCSQEHCTITRLLTFLPNLMQHMLLSMFLTNKALGKSLIHFRERKSFFILGNIRHIIKSTKKLLKWCVCAFNYSKKGYSRTFTLLTCVWSNRIVFFQTPLLSEAHSFVRYQSSEWGIRMLFISEHKGVVSNTASNCH